MTRASKLDYADLLEIAGVKGWPALAGGTAGSTAPGRDGSGGSGATSSADSAAGDAVMTRPGDGESPARSEPEEERPAE